MRSVMCARCQSIDPAPASHEPGSIQVQRTWNRLAADVTHYRGKRYLTFVDCGPSRFAIWKEIPSESAEVVSRLLDELFRERGPADELLMDNGASFRSQQVADVCSKWNVRRRFRGALQTVR